MKRIFIILLTFTGITFAAVAQESETMYVVKNSVITHRFNTAEIDSIIFYEPATDNVYINGVVWATRNVGAPGKFVDNPEDAGMFYQWNSKVGWSSKNPLVSTNGSTSWNENWNGYGATIWETANNVCPEGYRIPTNVELQSLVNAGNRIVTLNGVNGRIFGSDEPIFLPVAGRRRYGDHIEMPDITGAYHSSVSSGDIVYSLYFSLGPLTTPNIINSFSKKEGLLVRCVAE